MNNDNPHFVKTLRTSITLAPCEGCAADNNTALCKKLKTNEDFCGDYFFKHSKPNYKLMSDEEIEQIQTVIPDWDDREYSLSFARAIESKVVENLKAQPKPPLLSAKAIADTWNKHAAKNELYSIIINNFAIDIESQVRSQYES